MLCQAQGEKVTDSPSSVDVSRASNVANTLEYVLGGGRSRSGRAMCEMGSQARQPPGSKVKQLHINTTSRSVR